MLVTAVGLRVSLALALVALHHRGAGGERAHPGRQSRDPSGADDGARGDGAGIFRPASGDDRAGRVAEAAAVRLADRLHLRAVRPRARRAGPRTYAIGLAAYVGKLAVAGVALGVFETSIAKMRVFRVPNFLGAALMLGLLGTLLLFVSRSA